MLHCQFYGIWVICPLPWEFVVYNDLSIYLCTTGCTSGERPVYPTGAQEFTPGL